MGMEVGPARVRTGPAAPLHVWAEENVFLPDDLTRLLHLEGENVLSLRDIVNDVADGRKSRKLARMIADHGQAVVPRNYHRWDVTLSSTWVSYAYRHSQTFREVHSYVDRVRRNVPVCRKASVEWHAMLVRPGSPDQPPHFDCADARCYYTFLVQLTDAVPGSGGTSFPNQGWVVRSFGGATLFRGNVWHFGLGNTSGVDRVVLYAAIFTGKKEDCND
jgi:hypothetical protein